MMKFILKKSKNRQFYFVLTARNGEKMFHSETYTRKASAIKAIKSLQKGVTFANVKDETNLGA